MTQRQIAFTAIFALFLMMPFAAQSENSSEDVNSESYYLCRLKDQGRTLKVEKKEDGCVTIYTKNGQPETVGHSTSVPKCREILNRVKENLEKGNWSCRDISSSRVSSSESL